MGQNKAGTVFILSMCSWDFFLFSIQTSVFDPHCLGVGDRLPKTISQEMFPIDITVFKSLSNILKSTLYHYYIAYLILNSDTLLTLIFSLTYLLMFINKRTILLISYHIHNVTETQGLCKKTLQMDGVTFWPSRSSPFKDFGPTISHIYIVRIQVQVLFDYLYSICQQM